MSKLNPIAPVVPSNESKGIIVMEGLFSQTPDAIWAAVEAVAVERFQLNPHIERNKIVVTGKSVTGAY